jgi:hypothetical protein
MNIDQEMLCLQRLTVKQLRTRYGEVFGEATNANHKTWLIKRILWRLQANSEGDLSERARQRAREIANDADLRRNPPKRPHPVITGRPTQTDNRLPPVGTILTRHYKGQSHQVTVLAKGFLYLDQLYKSLSAVAKAITGSHCNGYLFFGLLRKGDEQ